MPAVQSGKTYWITGGLGALGLFTAEWLADRGAGHIVLTGRTNPNPDVAKKLAEIRKKGAEVSVITADVGRRGDVERVLNTIRNDCPPIRGIIHAAGVLDDGILRQQTWERFETVLRPKIVGSWNLHRASLNLNLDFMVLYSSMAGLLGSPGQANHCAANTFMDSLAHMRQAAGLPGLSINWGAWAEAGAAVATETGGRASFKGLERFSPRTGLQLMEYLLESGNAQAAVIMMDWNKYFQHTYAAGSRPAILSALEMPDKTKSLAPERKISAKSGLLIQLQSTPVTQRLKVLTDFVHHEALRILGLDSSTMVDLDKPLNDLGLDSLLAVELRNALGRAVDLTLPATLLFDYPSIQSVSNYLSLEMNINPAPRHATSDPVAEEPESTEELLRRIENMQDGDIDRLISKNSKDYDS